MLATETNQTQVREFTPSPQQLAFFEELQKGSKSIALIAVAGSGKTTTIVHACQFLDPFKLNVFLAFNKRIVEELRTRLPSHVQCATFHSRGNQALSRSLPSRPRINFNKVPDALKKNLKWKDFLLYGAFASKLVGFAKNAGVGTELEEDSLPTWRSGPRWTR